MAYQFADGFDNYTNLSSIYDIVVNASISASYARFPAIPPYPNQGVFINGGYLRKNLSSNCNKIIAFCSFGLGTTAPQNPTPIMAFSDGGTFQCGLGVNLAGALQFYTQASTFSPVILASSSPGIISTITGTKPNHGIEIAITFSNGSGSVQCWLDGKVVIPLTSNLVTIHTANAYANQAHLGINTGAGYNSSLVFYSDYFRVWDGTGASQNAPVGLDCQKLTKLAQAPGDLTQWTPNGAASNWQASATNPPNSGIYNSSSGNLYDSYNMGSAGFLVAPTMIVARTYAEKDDGATRALEVGVRSSGVNGLSSPFAMSSSYAFVDYCVAVDPATGLAPSANGADSFQHLKYEST